jgi:hypothetical protein
MARDSIDRVLDKIAALDDKIDDVSLSQERRFASADKRYQAVQESLDAYERQARLDRRFWGVLHGAVVLVLCAAMYVLVLVMAR